MLRLGQSSISGRTEYAGCAKIATIEPGGLLSVYALRGLMNRIEWMDIVQAVTADDLISIKNYINRNFEMHSCQSHWHLVSADHLHFPFHNQ